jgi:homoserine dehydrogenase
MRSIGIGLAGLGNVGGEVARLLLARREDFRRLLGAELRLAAVCDGRPQAASRLRLPKGVRRLRRWQDLLRDPEIEVVVELFGGEGAARELTLGALSSGRHVVTANKMLLSRHWDEVFRASRRKGRRVYFEASVAGGIPLLQALREGLAANRILSVLGIFNGTTNHILTEMAHRGLPMREALRQAQRLGLAEKDPSLDLSGGDTAHKLSVLASVLAGRWFRPERIPCEGIEALMPEDIRFAVEKLGRTVRLVGKLAFDWDADPVRLEAHVHPTLVPLTHPLANVHGAYNAVLVDTSSAGDLMFYGRGAGPGPAASAILGDLLQLGRELASATPNIQSPLVWDVPKQRSMEVRDAPESDAQFYIRLRLLDRPGVLAQVAGTLGRFGISIAQIHQDTAHSSARAVPVMISTHAASARGVRASLNAIARLGSVSEPPVCLRML